MISTVSKTQSSPLAAGPMSILLWISAIAFAATLIFLAVLGRLGMAQFLTVIGALLLFTTGVIVASWRGRTMTAFSFFFADRKAISAATGFGGAADFIGGASLMVILSASAMERAHFVVAMLVGMVLMSAFFGHMLYRQRVSTVTGFLALRFPGQGTGLTAVPAVLSMLVLIALAEFAVARSVLQTFANEDGGGMGWLVLLLAVLPALIGGWYALVIANAVLALWAVLSFLLPALIIGLAPNLLSADGIAFASAQPLAMLPAIGGMDIAQGGAFSSLGAVCLLAFGFAVLPQAYSRSATLDRPAAAMEHVGWAALFAFLLIVAAPLSIALIIEGAPEEQAAALSSVPILNLLPYLALLFIAFNGLSASLLAFSSAAMRSLRRSRSEDPGERTMFGTRALCVALAVMLGLTITYRDIDVWQVLRAALLLGAGGLFVPLFASAQSRRVPAWSVGLSIIIGTSITVYGLIAPFVAGLPAPGTGPYLTTALAALVSFGLIIAGLFVGNTSQERLPQRPAGS